MSSMAFKDRPYFRRLLEVDDLLRRRKGVTCTTLAARWKTSTKTAQRFLDRMRNDFQAPIEFSREAQCFVYTNPEFRLPWIPIDGKDLFAVGVAMKVLQIYEGTPAARDMKQIYERLGSSMPAEVRIRPSSLVERLYVHQEPLRPISPDIWEHVAEALRGTVALRITYQPPGSPAAEREIEPYSLVVASANWLLAARDPDDDVVKTFYLSRIRKAVLTGRRYAIPKTFDPARRYGESIGIYVGEETFRFRVRFSAEIAEGVAETRWHPKQKLSHLPGGDIELELPASSLWEARRFVLSFGHFAKVLSPPELVKDVREEIRKMARN